MWLQSQDDCQQAIGDDIAFSASGNVVCVGVTTVELCDSSALSHIAPQHLFAYTCIVLQTTYQHLCRSPLAPCTSMAVYSVWQYFVPLCNVLMNAS